MKHAFEMSNIQEVFNALLYFSAFVFQREGVAIIFLLDVSTLSSRISNCRPDPTDLRL